MVPTVRSRLRESYNNLSIQWTPHDCEWSLRQEAEIPEPVMVGLLLNQNNQETQQK